MQIHGGQHSDESVQQQRGVGGAVPDEQADEGHMQSMERGRLGDAGRPGEDRLDESSVHRTLPEH